MTLPTDPEERKKEVIRIFCCVILPRSIKPQAVRSLGGRVDERIMNLALSGARRRIEAIINSLTVVTLEALLIKLPGPAFMEFLLTSEYLYHNALAGEQAVLKYSRRRHREPEGKTVSGFARAFGYKSVAQIRELASAAQDDLPEGGGRDALEALTGYLGEAA